MRYVARMQFASYLWFNDQGIDVQFQRIRNFCCWASLIHPHAGSIEARNNWDLNSLFNALQLSDVTIGNAEISGGSTR